MAHGQRGMVGLGLGFVILFVVGGLLLGELFGAFADSDAFFVDYYSTDDHHRRDLIGGHLFVVSALLLLLFLMRLVRHLRSLGASEADLQTAQLSGVIAVTLLLGGAAAVLTVTMAQAFGGMTDDTPLTTPAVALAPQLGYVLVFFPAPWAAALAIACIAWSGWRARIWPRSLRWLSVTAALLLPLSWVGFMPIVLLPLWVLGVSIWAWQSRGNEPPIPDTGNRPSH